MQSSGVGMIVRRRPIWHTPLSLGFAGETCSAGITVTCAHSDQLPRCKEQMISHAVIAEAARFRQAFQAAQPFKHVCIDDFFTSYAAEAAIRDFPPFDQQFARNEFGEYGGKAVINNIREISPFYATLYDYLMSA